MIQKSGHSEVGIMSLLTDGTVLAIIKRFSIVSLGIDVVFVVERTMLYISFEHFVLQLSYDESFVEFFGCLEDIFATSAFLFIFQVSF